MRLTNMFTLVVLDMNIVTKIIRMLIEPSRAILVVVPAAVVMRHTLNKQLWRGPTYVRMQTFYTRAADNRRARTVAAKYLHRHGLTKANT